METTQITKTLEILTKYQYPNAKIWQDLRIYLNMTKKNINAYIEFDDSNATDYVTLFDGCKLVVFSNTIFTIKYPEKVNRRRKKLKHEIGTYLYTAGICDFKPCDNWQDIILHP